MSEILNCFAYGGTSSPTPGAGPFHAPATPFIVGATIQQVKAVVNHPTVAVGMNQSESAAFEAIVEPPPIPTTDPDHWYAHSHEMDRILSRVDGGFLVQWFPFPDSPAHNTIESWSTIELTMEQWWIEAQFTSNTDLGTMPPLGGGVPTAKVRGKQQTGTQNVCVQALKMVQEVAELLKANMIAFVHSSLKLGCGTNPVSVRTCSFGPQPDWACHAAFASCKTGYYVETPIKSVQVIYNTLREQTNRVLQSQVTIAWRTWADFFKFGPPGPFAVADSRTPGTYTICCPILRVKLEYPATHPHFSNSPGPTMPITLQIPTTFASPHLQNVSAGAGGRIVDGLALDSKTIGKVTYYLFMRPGLDGESDPQVAGLNKDFELCVGRKLHGATGWVSEACVELISVPSVRYKRLWCTDLQKFLAATPRFYYRPVEVNVDSGHFSL
jgi:hypothetical protein